jgi:tRNA threonylcarbamoyladenosine biosynthesis protein TsaE
LADQGLDQEVDQEVVQTTLSIARYDAKVSVVERLRATVTDGLPIPNQEGGLANFLSVPLTFLLPNADATHQLGVSLGQALPAGSVLLLKGDLGSGKTTLVQGIGKGLGINEPIASPTFILLNEYHEGRIPLYHFDLYRLEPSEVEALYLEAYWDGQEYPPGIVAIEWAERLSYVPPNALTIHLTDTPSGERQANLSWMKEPPITQAESQSPS